MNNNSPPPFGSSEQGAELLLSSTQAEKFRTLLKTLPHQDKRPRKKRKDTTLEDLVAEFYSLLEEARTQRGYTYEQLAALFKDYLGLTIAKDTLRKYMGEIRSGKRQQEKPPISHAPQPATASAHKKVSFPPEAHQPIEDSLEEKPHPLTRLPSSLTKDPGASFRKTRHYR